MLAGVRPLGVLWAALALALTLSGCASGGAGRDGTMGAADSESAARMADSSDIVFVVPPEGVPLQTSLILADAIAAEIRDSDHPAILARAPNQAGASVVGVMSSAVPRGQVTWMIIDWSVRAPYGTLVSTYRQQVVVDTLLWRQGAPEAINLVVGDAARNIVNMVHGYVGPPSAVAMNHSRIGEQPATAQPPVPERAGTTMDERIAEQVKLTPPPPVDTTPAEPIAVTEQAPAPPATAAPQPLAHISADTYGQVVHAPGAQPTQPAPPPPAAAPPSDLPLLPGTQAAEAAPATAAPRALTPGGGTASARPVGQPSVAPPPGGLVAPEKDEGLLAQMTPNMDADARRPGDARPAGPGGAAFAPVRWGQPAFLIKPVTGAPGNGNEALTAALKSALRDKDLTISEDPRQAGFVIQGIVDAGQPVNGRQYVRITWAVDTVTGEEVGKAVQENTVVAGSLDGEWGHVAEVVSHAAVRGIKDLFGEADDNHREREVLPEFPDVQLPQVPGRAPPPPSSL